MIGIQDIRGYDDKKFREELYKILVDLAKEIESNKDSLNSVKRNSLLDGLLYLFPKTISRGLPDGMKETNGMNKTSKITVLDTTQIIIAQKV